MVSMVFSMVFEILRAMVNDGLEANGLHVPFHKKVRKMLRTTGKLDFTTKEHYQDWNGNCDRKKVPFFLENTLNFIDLRRLFTS